MGQRPSGISIRIREDLVAGSARTQTTLICDPIITLDGHRLATADIGDICFAKLDQGTSNEEIISFTGITDNTTTYTLTGCVWGYNFYNSTGSVEANKKKHNSGSSFVITNDDIYLVTQYVNADSDQTIAGIKTFSSTPKSTAGDPLVGTDLVIKSYVDALVLGTLTTINVIVPGKAGETVVAGQLMYFDLTDNEWKLTDADTAATVENVLLGIAQGAGTNGNAITDGVLLQGVDNNQSGLTEGDVYYASDTAGAIANAAGTVEITVGLGKSATELYFNPRFNQQITEDQQDALAGTSGTPSSTNKYVTNDDTATAATANKVVRRNADGSVTGMIQAFGDGSDGDVTTSGNVTLTRDMFYNNLTVAAGHTINPDGFRIYVKGTLTIAATGFISRVGNAGGAGNTGVAGAGDVGGAAGVALNTNTVFGSAAGAVGGVGENSNNNDGTAGGNGTAATFALVANATACSGGAGGDNASGTGKAGGTKGSVTVSTSLPRSLINILTFQDPTSFTAPWYKVNSSNGAGGGGAGGNAPGYGGSGGGSGSNGGVIWIAANSLINNGTITVKGGAGGNGGAGGATNGCGGGGGAGGSGGLIFIVYSNTLTIGTTDITGGTGGTGGAADGAGAAGENGSNGLDGLLQTIQI